MKYETVPDEQVKLATWALEHTVEILRSPSPVSWNSRWLEILKQSSEEGFHPSVPKYGFGDATAYRLIEAVVEWTKATGAVRHGAESFNYYFPQELDEEYLIVWEKFPDKPWAYKTEEQLREFLFERIVDGYCFPLNPVWPVRDKGWYELFDALENSPEAQPAMRSWFPPGSGISERIRDIHEQFPNTFSTKVPPGTPERKSQSPKLSDLDMCERVDLGLYSMGNNKVLRRANTQGWNFQGTVERGISMYLDLDSGPSPSRLRPDMIPSPRDTLRNSGGNTRTSSETSSMSSSSALGQFTLAISEGRMTAQRSMTTQRSLGRRTQRTLKGIDDTAEASDEEPVPPRPAFKPRSITS